MLLGPGTAVSPGCRRTEKPIPFHSKSPGSQANIKWHGHESELLLHSLTKELFLTISRMKEKQKTFFSLLLSLQEISKHQMNFFVFPQRQIKSLLTLCMKHERMKNGWLVIIAHMAVEKSDIVAWSALPRFMETLNVKCHHSHKQEGQEYHFSFNDGKPRKEVMWKKHRRKVMCPCKACGRART